MPLFFAPSRDVVAFGAEHSTLGTALRTVAARRGVLVSPDPMPDETIFVRSDQYAFVREGVPAVYLCPGMLPVDPAVNLVAAEAAFRKERYHKPSDDLTQPIDWPSAGNYAGLMTELTRAIADDPQSPAWLPGDFFGGLFGKH